MVIKIIAIVLLLVICVGLIYMIINSIAQNMNNKISTDLVNKLSVFDEIIEGKRELLNELNQKIESFDLSKEEPIVIYQDRYNFQEKDILYKDEEFRDNYLEIKNKYQNLEENLTIIKQFVGENGTKNGELYTDFAEMEKKLSCQLIEELLVLEKNEQIEHLQAAFNTNQKLILEKYCDENTFDIFDFIFYVEVEKEKNDNQIYIIGTQEYENIQNEFVKYVYDSNVIEGFKIKYKNTIYDYSFC
ncbi:MAG: hypothetical protein ACRCUP_01155 [Mycoplasmatales bacterium]